MPRMRHRPYWNWIRLRRAATTALLASSAIVGITHAADAASRVSTNRLWGYDRYETATAVAQEFADILGGTDVINAVIVAPGKSFAEALAATPLAAVSTAPILLTPPDELHSAPRRFIEQNDVAQVVIVGNSDAVSAKVEQQLAELIEGTPKRLAGPDFYQTVVNISREVAASEVGYYCNDNRRTALLATGKNFADALALSPLAFAGQHPVLLTDPDELPTAVKDFIKDYTISQVLIAGGPAAVSKSVENELVSAGINVLRVWGQNRFETATEIAKKLTECDFGSQEFGLADGRNFPDALVSGVLLGLRSTPLLLSEPALPEATRTFLAGPVPNKSTVRLTVFGGRAAVANATVEAAVDALKGINRNCDPRTDTAGAPREVTVTPLNGALTVSWKAPAPVGGTVGNTDPSGYTIRYRLPPQGDWDTKRNASSPETISGLSNGVLYEVQVRAEGSGYGTGNEIWSPSGYATPSNVVTAAVATSSLPDCLP